MSTATLVLPCPILQGHERPISTAIEDQKNKAHSQQKREFKIAHFPVCYKETAARFELSGARLPQNRRPFLCSKRGCVGS